MVKNNIGRVVITGGPGSGKTTLIEQLALKGFNVVEEVARPLIKFLTTYDPDKATGNFMQDMIEVTQLKDWVGNPNAIFDRGLPDQIAYRDFLHIPISKDLLTKCAEYKYDKVFYLPFWRDIYTTDNTRAEDIVHACVLGTAIRNSYKKLGYEVVEVPKVSVKARVKFILNNLKLC